MISCKICNQEDLDGLEIILCHHDNCPHWFEEAHKKESTWVSSFKWDWVEILTLLFDYLIIALILGTMIVGLTLGK